MKDKTMKLDLQMFATASTQNQNTTGASGMSAEMKTFYEKRLIDQAEPALVHDQFGDPYPIPANGGKNIEFRKYDSLPKATTPLTEGVTPDGQTMNVSTVTAEVKQYGGWVPLTDMVQMTTIDNNAIAAGTYDEDMAYQNIVVGATVRPMEGLGITFGWQQEKNKNAAGQDQYSNGYGLSAMYSAGKMSYVLSAGMVDDLKGDRAVEDRRAVAGVAAASMLVAVAACGTSKDNKTAGGEGGSGLCAEHGAAAHEAQRPGRHCRCREKARLAAHPCAQRGQIRSGDGHCSLTQTAHGVR